MQTRQITSCACALLWAISALAADGPDVEAPELHLKQLHQLLHLSARSSTTFSVEKRWENAQDGRTILGIRLSYGGSASIDERMGTVFRFTDPHFGSPQDLDPEQILAADDAFAKLLPVLKAYSLSESPQDYRMVCGEGIPGLWHVYSKPSPGPTGKPASLYAALAADSGKLVWLSYLPPLEPQASPLSISKARAIEIAQSWLASDSPPIFKESNPRVKEDDVEEDLIRGYRAGLDNWRLEQRALTKEVHLCWGVPFVVDDRRIGTAEYRVWVDVSTGMIIDVTGIDEVNK